MPLGGFDEIELLLETALAFGGREAEFDGEGSQALVGVVVAEPESVFGAGGEHAVGVFDAFGHEVVNHDADEAVAAGEGDFGLAGGVAGGVDSGDDALAGGFFVSAGAVDLTGEEEAGEELGHEGRLELEGVGHVVFDGVAGADEFGFFEARDGVDGGELDGFG